MIIDFNVNSIGGGGGNDKNAVKFIEQDLTAAQQGQARTNIDAASVADLDNIQSQEYVPVTTLPTASASTLGKIYLVGPDANNEYARKITSYDGTSYSWVDCGTTDLDLSGYATDAELDQLSQEVDTKADQSDLNQLAQEVYVGEYAPKQVVATRNIRPTSGGIIVGNNDYTYIAEVSSGDEVRIMAHVKPNDYMRVGFTAEYPVSGSSVSGSWIYRCELCKRL